MKVAVALAHGHVPKYLQLVINSMKQMKNNVEFDIYVAETWPGHPSIKAITENDLGDNVTIIQCQRRKHSHATALEEILEHIWDKDYKYFFATETDCRAVTDHWLDWFVNMLETNDKAALAGFFWDEGNNHYNINPSATLYRMDMLKQYHTEARNNNSDVFYHPKGNRMGTDAGMDPTIKDVVGCFAETRGIANPTPKQMAVILKGIPQAAWFEPGAWLYARLQGEWDEVRAKCDHVYRQYAGNHTAPEATYYGSKAFPIYIHYWGGTRTYDFLKHPVNDNFVRSCAPEWIQRENKLWREFVPERYHAIVHDIMNELNVEKMMKENLGIFVPEVM
jgi:hypothetical protein